MNDEFEHPKQELDGLKGRALYCMGNNHFYNKAQIRHAILSGVIRPLVFPRNYGWKTHEQVCEWAELPKPQKPETLVRVKNKCPHCGGKLK